jgi:hypothetical protein
MIQVPPSQPIGHDINHNRNTFAGGQHLHIPKHMLVLVLGAGYPLIVFPSHCVGHSELQAAGTLHIFQQDLKLLHSNGNQ